ncbi:transposable element Tcb1 transposase [Trichonephila clavipes]|nr:transposable element Tcb1 transposase [Trichonephila clavipes]
MLNSCVMHRYTGPVPVIMVWGDIGYHSRTPVGLATAIFQQDNARPHKARIVQRFFFNHQIDSLPWPARSPDHGFSTIDPDYTPAATPYQLWQRVEAAWSAVPQEHIPSLFESMPRRVAAVTSNDCGYSGY